MVGARAMTVSMETKNYRESYKVQKVIDNQCYILLCEIFRSDPLKNSIFGSFYGTFEKRRPVLFLARENIEEKISRIGS